MSLSKSSHIQNFFETYFKQATININKSKFYVNKYELFFLQTFLRKMLYLNNVFIGHPFNFIRSTDFDDEGLYTNPTSNLSRTLYELGLFFDSPNTYSIYQELVKALTENYIVTKETFESNLGFTEEIINFSNNKNIIQELKQFLVIYSINKRLHQLYCFWLSDSDENYKKKREYQKITSFFNHTQFSTNNNNRINIDLSNQVMYNMFQYDKLVASLINYWNYEIVFNKYNDTILFLNIELEHYKSIEKLIIKNEHISEKSTSKPNKQDSPKKELKLNAKPNKQEMNKHLDGKPNKQEMNKPLDGKPTKTKKKPVPKKLRQLVWNKWIGEEIGKAKCLCCKSTDISQLDFSCGHIISEKNGGDVTLQNLKPICNLCNSSMGVSNMNDFITKHGI